MYHFLPLFDFKIYTLTNLVELDVSNNVIIAFSEEFGGMYSLERVYANVNKLAHLPASIGKLKKLTTFEVRANLLEQMCNEISDCSSLIKLDFRFQFLDYQLQKPQSFAEIAGRITFITIFKNYGFGR